MVTPLLPSDPRLIGRYSIQGRLGAGGMGTVYLGQSPGGRPAAIKVINERFGTDEDSLARFRREVEVLRTVRSAYTAALIDCQLEQEPYWFATEYIPGPTLDAAIERNGPLPPDGVYRLLAALAEGLADIHQHGICHRDLKPQNVILASTGPQLIDFGIARGADHDSLTQTGAAIGSPGFCAPEVLASNQIGPPADVFALGATATYAVTGRKPFGEGTFATIVIRSMKGEIDLSGVEPRLAELLRSCVAIEPGYRPTSEQIIEACRSQIPAFLHPTGDGQAALGGVAAPTGNPLSVTPVPAPATEAINAPGSFAAAEATTSVVGPPPAAADSATQAVGLNDATVPGAANPAAGAPPLPPQRPASGLPGTPYPAPYPNAPYSGPPYPGATQANPQPPYEPRPVYLPPGVVPPGQLAAARPGRNRTPLWVALAVLVTVIVLGGGSFAFASFNHDKQTSDAGPKLGPAGLADSANGTATPAESSAAGPSEASPEPANSSASVAPSATTGGDDAQSAAPNPAGDPTQDTSTGLTTWVDVATKLCLDGDATGKIYTMGCNGGDYQKWTPKQANGGFTFTSKATGLCLDSNAARSVYAMPCNGGDYQVWSVTANGAGSNLKDKATGFLLDSNAAGQVYAFDANGGDYQRWTG